ncbi:HNH endonuclease [Halalkalibacterium ligniniphilum]|uniref:HNH endonuclease n=1 Tax=Halalkalibacterium ligniniphilum TaxID=1134413 RepID=UPI00035D8655
MRLDLEPIRSVAKPKHKRKSRKRADRGKFTDPIRKKIKEHFQHTCQECGGRGHHCHHVKPKGSGVGRGVFTNGLLLCKRCHDAIHNELDQTRLKYWQNVFKEQYGIHYFRDKEDLERISWERRKRVEDLYDE